MGGAVYSLFQQALSMRDLVGWPHVDDDDPDLVPCLHVAIGILAIGIGDCLNGILAIDDRAKSVANIHNVRSRSIDRMMLYYWIMTNILCEGVGETW